MKTFSQSRRLTYARYLGRVERSFDEIVNLVVASVAASTVTAAQMVNSCGIDMVGQTVLDNQEAVP